MMLDNRDKFVRVDESGSYAVMHVNHRGTLRGIVPVCHRFLACGKSLICKWEQFFLILSESH